AHVEVTLDCGGEMSVVVGSLPGASGREIWLTSHLCHPAPGANDNASGVAATLGIARVLAADRCERRFGIRFIWGPEFLGTVAYLHAHQSTPPAFVVNLDMVGENQRLCRSPLVVELPPDHKPSCLPAMTDHVLRHIGGRRTWRWSLHPFVGRSDHAVFADRRCGAPAVSFGHPADVFNHSSLDTVDKVDPEELRRCAGAAGLLVQLLSAAETKRHVLAKVVCDWALREIDRAAQASFVEAVDCRHYVSHIGQVALDALGSLGVFDGVDGEVDACTRRCRAHAEQVAATLPTQDAAVDRQVGMRRWEGPFNARAMIADLPEQAGDAAQDDIRRHPLDYSLVMSLA